MPRKERRAVRFQAPTRENLTNAYHIINEHHDGSGDSRTGAHHYVTGYNSARFGARRAKGRDQAFVASVADQPGEYFAVVSRSARTRDQR